MNVIVALIKERSREILPLSPGEDIDICELGSRASPDKESATTLILNFSAFRSVRNKFLLLTSHPVYGILPQQSEHTKTNRYTMSSDMYLLILLLCNIFVY